MTIAKIQPFHIDPTKDFTFGNTLTGNLKTDNLLYANGDPYVFTSSAAGTNTQIQFNDGSSFAGDANLTFNKTTGTLTAKTITGNVSLDIANLRITGGTANYVLATDGTGNLSWAEQTGGTGGGGSGEPFLAVVNSFTGDGTTVTFSLTATPAGSEYTLVTIGGVSQPRSSFSIVADEITFTSPPPNQTIIEITILGGSAVALGTATTVTSAYQPNIIQVGTLLTLDVTGNVTSNNFIGNLIGSSNSASTAGTVTTNAQPNITSLGTLSNLTVTGNITTASGKFFGDGSGLSNVASAQQVTGSSQPNITSVGTLTQLDIAGAFSSSSFSEPVTVITGAASTVTHNFSLSSTFIHLTPAANFAASITNVPITDNRIVVVALIIYQGSTAYIPNSILIDGFGYTPKWANGVAPVGTPNKVDVFSYSLVRYNGGWDIFGQTSTYGVV